MEQIWDVTYTETPNINYSKLYGGKLGVGQRKPVGLSLNSVKKIYQSDKFYCNDSASVRKFVCFSCCSAPKKPIVVTVDTGWV